MKLNVFIYRKILQILSKKSCSNSLAVMLEKGYLQSHFMFLTFPANITKHK